MTGVDPRAFEFALQKIDDGFVFEKFVHGFVGAVVGQTFEPSGGIHDRGIDGLEHVFQRKELSRYVYQASIEKDPTAKIRKTLVALEKNLVEYEALYFVTNQIFRSKDKAIDELFESYHKPIHIYDLKWLSSHVNDSDITVNHFQVFVESYLHDFTQPGKTFVVGDLVDDPRLFVFLRQQWETYRRDLDLGAILADTLILYALEGTDPDKNVFRTRDDIHSAIARYIKFDPRTLTDVIDKRLKVLSTKPRRIRSHGSDNAYCLPFETRVLIQERNLRDAALHEEFKTLGAERLHKYLGSANISTEDALALLEQSFHRLFHQQGLEFADFVLKGENREAFEKRLPDIIAAVVDGTSVKISNRESVKTILLVAIRDLIYRGSPAEKEFLSRLSHTYMMLFLLQFDPKLAVYFKTMASKLTVYVCTSIIIPALSEFYLAPPNRRHWNLLKEARNAGVNLVVNETILRELVSHFRMITHAYEEEYRAFEDVYLADEMSTLYIEEIMIRAYFYSKMHGEADTFGGFIDNFVTPNLRHAEEELVEWLKTEFGIQYRPDKNIGCKPDKAEVERLYEVLKRQKTHQQQARSDANLILTIFAIREKNNERADGGIFGYRTWWLSKDTVTQRAVNEAFRNKYPTSCYIRPDFLHNYICLTPSSAEIDSAYHELFPTLLGVNISFNLPGEVIDVIHKQLREHKDKNVARLTSVLRMLTDKMKVDPTIRTNRGFVQHYLEGELSKISS